MPEPLALCSRALAQSGPLTLSAPGPREVAPDSYVTLTFTAEGQGEFTFEVDSPPDWVPVTRRRTLTLRGRTLVPVSFRVPGLAPVGASPPLTLRAMQGEREVARAQATVQVLAQARVALRSPLAVEAMPGETLSVPVEVCNLGNETDTVRLRVTNVDGRPQLSVPEVRLAPGEATTVTVSLDAGQVSEGYRYVLFVEAASARNPEARATTRTDAAYRTAAGQQAAALEGPSLLFRVRTSAEAGVTWSPGGTDWTVRYALEPTLSGALSDSVRGTADVSGLTGDRGSPLPQGTTFGLQLGAERWVANLALGAGGGELGGTVLWGAWRVSPRVQYTRLPDGRVLGAGVRASTQVAGVGQSENGLYQGSLFWTQQLNYQGGLRPDPELQRQPQRRARLRDHRGTDPAGSLRRAGGGFGAGAARRGGLERLGGAALQRSRGSGRQPVRAGGGRHAPRLRAGMERDRRGRLAHLRNRGRVAAGLGALHGGF